MSSPRPPPWPVPPQPHSPPASPTPSRLPKPKGNRLTKSPDPSGKRGKSPGRAKGQEDRRTSLQVNTPPASSSVHSGSNRRLSLGARPPSTTGKQPTTPTIAISFASSGSGLNSLSPSASASSTSFNQSHGNDSPNSTSTHLPLSSRNTSPHSSWIPGAPYMPGTNSTTLAAITTTPQENPDATQFPASISDSSLIPPQGLFGPLLVRENILRARERERAASMGMTSSITTPASLGQSQPAAMSASAGQIHGLLEASGLVVPQENGTVRGRFNSVASHASATTTSSWSNTVSMNTTIGAGAGAGVNGMSSTTVGANGRNTPSNASSGHLLPIGDGEGEGEEEEGWLRREGMLDGMSSMTHDTYHSYGREGGASSNLNLPRGGSPAPEAATTSSVTPTPTPVGPISAAPVKLSKSSSLRSTLPSIRSFRNPFSFSRSASTSGAPSSEKREKSKERSKSKERPTILPIGNRNRSGSNVNLPVPPPGPGPSSPTTSRHTYIPTSQRNQPSSPVTPTFTSPMHTQTLPRASVDTILPNSAHLHGANTASPGSASRFGFSVRAGRHSMDSPVGYAYGRLGTMFAGAGGSSSSPATPLPTSTSTSLSGGRLAVQAPYVNGSRERIVAEQGQFQQSHTHSASLGGLGGTGRGSTAPGWSSPAFGGGGLGITGLVRPPGLDPHIELDERSLRTESGYGFGGPPSERTESGYGFGGIQVSGDGIMLSPVDDLDEPYSFASHMGEHREHEEDEEGEVRALLGEGVFEGEYESTEGHAAAAWASSPASARVSPALTPYESRPISQANTFGAPEEPPASSYPYPTTYPEQEQSPDSSGEVSNTTLAVDAEPRLPPGLEHLIRQVDAQNGNEMERDLTRDSAIERDLLGELARQLQRVVEQQSTTTLASKAPLSPTQPHTPSSMLLFEMGDSSQGHGRASEDTERVDEFGRWNIGDLKGAVERMKALIDEQEKRSQRAHGHAHSKSTNSISLNDTPPRMPDASLPLENAERSFPSFGGENGQTTPRRRLSNVILTAQDVRADTKRKESQSSSSATATSTTVVTPITPHDGPSFPLPTFKNAAHERVESFDFASLDPDLVAMLSPNHIGGGQDRIMESDQRGSDVADNGGYGISFASSGLLPSTSSSSTPSGRNVTELDHSTFNTPGSQQPAQSFAMGGDLTIATAASDGFGSMRSDRSIEEILLQRNFDYDQTGVEDENKDDHSNSIILDALALEPVATSSPPRKKLLHTPRASSVSILPASNSSKRDRQEKASSSSSHLLTVNEEHQSQFAFPSQASPSKSSPSRSPMSKLRGKERPPLPQFETDQQESERATLETDLARKTYLNSNKSAGAHILPSPSPTPPSRTLQGTGTMLTQLGHGRRPQSRTGGSEISSIDRMRRVVTSGTDTQRSLNHEEVRHPRLQSITGSQSDTPPSRIGLDLSLGPRTARAFAAAGVLDGGPGSAPTNRVSTWRSASVMGYRRDGIEREFGNTSGVRSLASSPVPMTGVPGPSGAAARRINALQDRESNHGPEGSRTRAASDAWNRSVFSRTPDSSLRNLNMGGAGTDPSATSSPTSTAPPRTTMSSTSSNLPPFELKSYRGSPTAPDAAAANAQQAHQAAIQTLKERHELEKEALLSALSEAKKDARVEKAAKEELSLELTEMGVYVEELETKLGEALARMRWMEKEIGILKDAVGVARRGSPMRDPQTSLRQSIESKRFKRISNPAPGTYNDDNIFDPSPNNARLADSPTRTKILINHVPASPPGDEEEPRHFPVYEEDQSPLRNRSHHRISSDASSIVVPRVDQSMSMLLQENGYADGYDESGLYSANEGSTPPSPTIIIGRVGAHSGETKWPLSTADGNLLGTGPNRAFGLQTPRRRNQPPSTIMEMSPTTTTADYSFNPGSPGSLVLRPEDEHHLGDLVSLMGSDDGM